MTDFFNRIDPDLPHSLPNNGRSMDNGHNPHRVQVSIAMDLALPRVVLVPELVPESLVRIELRLECQQTWRVGVGT